MVDHAALRAAFRDYAEALLRRYDIGDMLYRLTDHTLEILGVDGAGVSLGFTPDDLRFVSATDDRVARMEAAQIDVGEGPCYEAFRSGEPVAVDDLMGEQRWPEYRRHADEQTFRAVAGIPMPVGGSGIGAIDLYSTAPRDWTSDDLRTAQLLANVASGYIVNWRALDEKTTLTQQLQRALDSRVVVEQAKGMIAGRNGVDVSEAFQRLRKYSRDTQTKIHEVARQVVDGELTL